MQRRRKLLLIRRGSRHVVRRRRIVIDLAQGNPVAAPAAFEGAGIHVVYQDTLVQESVSNVDLVRVLVKVEGGDAGRKSICLLIVLLHLIGGHLGAAMPKVPQQLTVARKF